MPFSYEEEPAAEALTSFSGVAVFAQAFRSLGIPESVRRHIQIKQRDRGLDEATQIESLAILNAVGGDCLDDLNILREDAALAELVGHDFPSPEAARKFLYQFHDAEKLKVAEQRQLELGQNSCIPEEGARLAGLGKVNEEAVQVFGRRCAEQRIATIDVDATIIESHKREARATYEGVNGYQPVLALWAEMDVIVADEFRDGNVSAQTGLLPVAQRAMTALPETVQERYFRGDSACYEQSLLKWLRNQDRQEGPKGFIGFAISARMSEALHEQIRRLPESFWKAYREDSAVICECAEVLGWDPAEVRAGEQLDPIRYLIIRVRKRQGTLFGDGSLNKHYAVITNRWDHSAKVLLEWQREKAGSIEAAHDVLKNELAAGVMPCGRFGANAAWLRIAVLTYNVLSALKRLALPADMLRARPKRLRFRLFNTAGRVIHHARQRICRSVARIADWGGWASLLAALEPA